MNRSIIAVNVLFFSFYFLVERWQWSESLFSSQRTRTTHWSACDRRTSPRSTWSNCQRSALLCVFLGNWSFRPWLCRDLVQDTDQFWWSVRSRCEERHLHHHSTFDRKVLSCLLLEQRQTTLSFVPLRLREIDWLEFCTGTVVDSFATHVQLYRKAKERMRLEHSTDIRACFFDVEAEYEQGICRDDVCMDKDKEKGSQSLQSEERCLHSRLSSAR